jgi:hypothetical protein
VNHRRAILALFALAALIAGSAGYTTIQAERSVDVAVAGEGQAFLSVEAINPEIKNGSEEAAFEVTNRLGQKVDVTIQDSAATGSVGLGGVRSEEVKNGHTTDINATCVGTADGTLDVTVQAESDDGAIFVRVVRSSDISCTEAA